MAEPQPSQIHEGDQAPSAVPGSNKSEAAALDSLDRQTDTTTASKSGDAKALGQAMQKLDVADKSKPKDVKVEAGDVGLLVSFLVFLFQRLWERGRKGGQSDFMMRWEEKG